MTDAIQIDHETAAANIEAYANEGRLVQGRWHDNNGRGGDGARGRDLACLLGSMHPQIDDVRKCPGDLMPAWLAWLTEQLFDGLPRDRIVDVANAYARSLRRWHLLDAAAWERVRRAFVSDVLGGALRDCEAKVGANPPEPWPAVKALGDRLLAILLGDGPYLPAIRALREEARAVRDQAWTAYDAAVRRRRAAAEAVAAEAVAVAAAEAAAVAAVVAAAEAEAEAEAAAAEAVAARRQSYAKSFDTLLAIIDREIG